ncbi:MAG: DUF2147 domain-containing protein [Candidatus Limimorpha sp.]
MKKSLFSLLFFFVITLAANAQVSKILGEWRTVDDKTGETKGVVLFYQNPENGLYYGKLTHVYYQGQEIFDPEYVGLVIIKDMKNEDGVLTGGSCFDPDSGKTYYGKITYNAKNNTITLKGSIDKAGFIGRSQTWVK